MCEAAARPRGPWRLGWLGEAVLQGVLPRFEVEGWGGFRRVVPSEQERGGKGPLQATAEAPQKLRVGHVASEASSAALLCQRQGLSRVTWQLPADDRMRGPSGTWRRNSVVGTATSRQGWRAKSAWRTSGPGQRTAFPGVKAPCRRPEQHALPQPLQTMMRHEDPPSGCPHELRRRAALTLLGMERAEGEETGRA